MVEQTRTCSVFYIGVSDRYLLAQDAGALNFDYAEVFLGSFHYYNLAQCGIRKHYNWNFDISDLSKRQILKVIYIQVKANCAIVVVV